MKSACVSIRLPSHKIPIAQVPTSQPIAIHRVKESVSIAKFGQTPISSTPPNEFMEHLKKRLNGY